MSRFLPPKTQARVIKYKSVVFRYLRFLRLTPINWIRFIRLALKPPRTFQLKKTPQHGYKIACILDEFSFESFRPEADFLQLDVSNWKSEIESFKPDLILIESAWKGKNAGWARKISEISNEIVELADWGDRNNIPTVFWHKEVPPHIKTFMHVTRLFDVIFLTDADCIDVYKKSVGHERVHFLSFACQPKMHHPIQEKQRKHSVIYAGTFYPEYKYPDRHKNFMDLYDALSPKIDFDIYDRMAGKGNYTFPQKFHKHIQGSLPFSQIGEAYRSYDYGLNMNSVKNSSTMCSRRVFELIACNTLVIGNHSRAVENIFGNLTVCSDDREEIIRRFNELENNPIHQDGIRLRALRKVMEEYTYERNLQHILSTVSSSGSDPQRPILVVSNCSNQDQYKRTLLNFNRQEFNPRKLLVVSENAIDVDANILFCKPIDFLKTWGGIQTQFDSVAVFNPDWDYGSFYLTDLAHGFKYTDFQAVTKLAYWDDNETDLKIQNQGLQYRKSLSCLPTRSLLKTKNFNAENPEGCIDIDCVSIDAYNLCSRFDLTQSQIAKVEAHG